MVTWTTYGTWLQGDARGYVKDGEIRGENVALKIDCAKKLKCRPTRLDRNERMIVRDAILAASRRFRQEIRAIAVRSNHVHVVAEYVDVPIGMVVGTYKNAARVGLRKQGFEGRVWTRGYDRQFCFDQAAFKARITYVAKHEKAVE